MEKVLMARKITNQLNGCALLKLCVEKYNTNMIAKIEFNSEREKF